MLDAEMFRQDVTVVITDGMRVISTNCEQLENTLVQYYPIADVLVGGKQLTPDTLLQLKNDSDTWYGMFTQYRDYYLYAFFPSRVVYASRRGWMLLFTAIYLFCGMGYLIWRQYSKKRRLLRMEKEYHLISAISSIYLSNLLIHPQDDTWEPIVQSERMKAITNGVLSAKAMLEKFNTECVAEAYREEFRAFTDLDTAQQRLEGKALTASQWKMWRASGTSCFLYRSAALRTGKSRAHSCFCSAMFRSKRSAIWNIRKTCAAQQRKLPLQTPPKRISCAA